MLLNKKQLVKSLLHLVQGDYNLLNEIISDYVELIDNKQFDELEEYVNANLNEII